MASTAPETGRIHPVIMCGGAGTRLWPLSRPARPKQFADLGAGLACPASGEASLFQRTVARVRDLGDAAQLTVVAGAGQRDWVARQLAETPAHVILEPEGRDSAAAVAVAALAVAARDPDGILVIVASDHHVPRPSDFRAAIGRAVATAREGRIVMLGIEPRGPSDAYGYIRPSDPGAAVSPVAEFREKPPVETARALVDEGCLWNSGNFIAPAATLIEEFEAHASDILEGARQAIAGGRRATDGLILGSAFRDVRRQAVDRAVMEKTERASVVRAALDWSDLGAWDAIHALLPHDERGNAVSGDVVLSDTGGSLVFNASDRLAVTHGVEGLNVVVEDDVVFVSTLARAQEVKTALEGLKRARRAEIDLPGRERSLADEARRLGNWLDTIALPFWWTHGFDRVHGIWREELDASGDPTARPARARVQARQTWVYAQAGRRGWRGPWRDAVDAGLAAIRRYAGPDGLMTTLRAPDGTILDPAVLLYDQTFTLLAYAALAGMEGYEDAEARALAILDAIDARFMRAGAGYRESTDSAGHDGARDRAESAYQANLHMHLFEAALEWAEAGESPRWAALADRLAELALTRFMDRDGFLREFFDADWQPAEGDRGRVVEPGHQFEWAWLLVRHARRTGRDEPMRAARRLHAAGLSGIDPARAVAVETMDDGLNRISRQARLWQQTEWLKAELALASDDPEDQRRIRMALAAVDGYLARPLPPLWGDRCAGDGVRADDPTPASTLYHIACAIEALEACTSGS